MSLRFYSTDTASVRDFEPVFPGEARLYYCGATVQGMPHIGHVRSALVFDQLSRWLRYRGYAVTTVRNVTDIDDKILVNSAKSFEQGYTGTHPREPWWALAYRFERVFGQAYQALGIEQPTYEPRATGHIPEMISMIRELIDNGHAYPALDDSGDVYFDVRSWKSYGSLTRQSIDEMQAAPDADPRGKKDPRDFALWKGHKDDEPESASWESPWGRGRPGWHLECSAMAGKYLGERFDIHGGGLDLRFPHHENELAQSTASGRGFANFWLHNGLVTYEGDKMSKSIGNTVSPEEMLATARPLVVRYYLGQAHYRSILDYRPTSLDEAKTAVERVENFLVNAGGGSGLAEVPEEFGRAMDDDLNIPQALAVLHEHVRTGNSALSAKDGSTVEAEADAVRAMTDALGLTQLMDFGSAGSSNAEHQALDTLIRSLLTQRADARASKDWDRADHIRDELSAAGIIVKDSADGSSWSV
ncbi:cysteine--tRNA ligase [Kocuria sp. HSID16901]|uniref:cysteine--tRNA ligase n=1 Tax=Kocuria sp. HSID16901 TaxID=2419505 RepID=UPI0006610218|nr:cysteine--tRNA ligase [Kocuria sp. HSID16901]MCT1368490.1 cysteine--tRNA ligase [Rothia sp. p3-SID1597]RUQ20944.1 cysteine--tRNA ligase [Kocuria sp. HSID16901]